MDGRNSFVENWLSQAQYTGLNSYSGPHRIWKPPKNGSRSQPLPEWADNEMVQGPANFSDGHFQPFTNSHFSSSKRSADQNRTDRQLTKQFQQSLVLTGTSERQSSRSSAIGTSPSSTTVYSTPSSSELPSKIPQQNPAQLSLPNSEESQCVFNFFASEKTTTANEKSEVNVNRFSSDSPNANNAGAIRTNSMSSGSHAKPPEGFFMDGVFRPFRRFQRGIDLKPSRALDRAQKTGCFNGRDEPSAAAATAAGAAVSGPPVDSETHSDSCSVSQHSDPGSSHVPWEPNPNPNPNHNPESSAPNSLPTQLAQPHRQQRSSWRDQLDYRERERDARPPKVLAVGDSFLGSLTLFKRDSVRTLKFKGASARGLGNPDSTTGANEQTLAALAEWDAFALRARPPPVLLFFGNVDVHVNIFFKLSLDQVPLFDLDSKLNI